MESRGHTPHFGAQNKPGAPKILRHAGGSRGAEFADAAAGGPFNKCIFRGRKYRPLCGFFLPPPEKFPIGAPGGVPGNSGKFRGGLERLPGGPGGPPGGPREGGPPSPRTRLKLAPICSRSFATPRGSTEWSLHSITLSKVASIFITKENSL